MFMVFPSASLVIASLRLSQPFAVMVASAVAGTWLSHECTYKQRLSRYFILASMIAGLYQKPLIKFAWDVDAFVKNIRAVYDVSGRLSGVMRDHLLGGLSILLRQAFAARGQSEVTSMAMELVRRRRSWLRSDFVILNARLRSLTPADRGKRKGRIAQYSGPAWICGLYTSSSNLTKFNAASARLGAFMTSAVAAPNALHELCKALKDARDCKLHAVASYSVPHLVRACAVARADLTGHIASPCSQSWLHDLRNMHDDRTRDIFDLLGVFTFEQAHAMVSSVIGVARHLYSFRIMAKFSSMDLIDLPCQACEMGGVLSSVKRHLNRTSGRGASDLVAMKWVLQRLPASLHLLKDLGIRMRKIVGESSERGNGLDRQCAATVTQKWLQLVVAGDVQVTGRTFWDIFTRGHGGILGVPVLYCQDCGSSLQHQPGPGRRSTHCLSCRRSLKRSWDRKRKRDAA